jgi:DNA-binding transcriptional MerR regulator
MAELSRTTGVPVPTIKYYLREGLLAPGERTHRNQAEYGPAHVRRLRLIRALADVAGLPLAGIAEILAQVDSPDPQLHHTFGVVQHSVTAPHPAVDDETRAAAEGSLRDLVLRRGWQVGDDNLAWPNAVTVLATFLALGNDDLVATLDPYAEAMELVATADIGVIAQRTDLEHQVEGVVIGTLLGDALLAALRRLAHEDASARTFTDRATTPPRIAGKARD